MRIVYRNLNDLDEIIRAYEEKYKISSFDMLKDQSARTGISEDELLKWEAYVAQRRRLLDHNSDVHRHYLQRPHKGTNRKPSAAYDSAAYAA